MKFKQLLNNSPSNNYNAVNVHEMQDNRPRLQTTHNQNFAPLRHRVQSLFDRRLSKSSTFLIREWHLQS